MGSSSSGINIRSNPHAFFQPLLPDFLNSFSVPVAFLKKVEGELKGHELESVVLMREKEGHNKHWVVKIKGGRHFDSEDWKKFSQHHNLKVGDFVIFRHLGNLLFHVSVFDAVTACDCNEPHPHHSLSSPKQEQEQEEEEQEEEERSVPSKRKKGRPPFPSCNITLTSYCYNHSIVYLPRKFVKESGLERRTCEVILIDQKKRSWQVGLNYKKGDGQSYIKRGWKAFQDANLLKPTDVIKLQFVNAGGKHPVFKCSRLSSGRKSA